MASCKTYAIKRSPLTQFLLRMHKNRLKMFVIPHKQFETHTRHLRAKKISTREKYNKIPYCVSGNWAPGLIL